MASLFHGMSGEFSRLATFSGFEVPNGVWTLQLAKAGFQRNDSCAENEVICTFCGLKLDVRTLPRQSVVEVHRRLAPSCSFVAGASNNQPSKNSGTSSGWLAQNFSFGQPQTSTPQIQLPDVSSLSQLPQTLDLPDFSDGMQLVRVPESEMPVLGTQEPSLPFSPDPLEPSILPSLPSDFLDSLQNANISSLPNPVLSEGNTAPQHQSLPALGHPGEVLLTDGEGLPMEGTYPVEITAAEAQTFAAPPPAQKKNVTFDDLGIVVQRPKRQDLATIPKRLATFGTSWTGLQGEFQTTEMLAEAGFYYAGYADCCRCFYCGGGLKNWEKEDHPWIEHGRWFKSCPYVLTNKGQDFISAVEWLDRTNQKILMTDVEKEMKRVKELATEAPPPKRQDSQMSFTSDVVDDQGVVDEQETAERLASENDTLKQQTICKICLDNEVCILYVPCGHLVTCAVCAPTVQNCPVCRQRIKGQVRVQSD